MTRDEKQLEAVKKWIKAGLRGTCAWSTGVGKTRVGLIAIKSFLAKNPNTSISVIVPTENLKLQWIDELSRYNLINYVQVEVINSAIKTTSKLHMVVLDEAHRYASASFINIFKLRKPQAILGLSATFHRLDGRHKLLEKYCPVIDTVPLSEALANGWVSNYREYKVLLYPTDFDTYMQANQDFLDTFAVFNYDFNYAMKCLTDIIERRKYGKYLKISAKEMDAIVFTWNRSLKFRKNYVMNHPLKVKVTRQILNSRPFSKAITFSGTIKQAESIGVGQTIHSGKTKKKNRITLEEFSNMPTGVINTSKALDEGTDVPGLNLAVILTNNSSATTKTQRIGRTIRAEEGKVAEIFTLVIANTIEEKWFESSSQFSSYNEITLDELQFVLDGGNIRDLNVIEETGKEVEQLFRL